MEDVIVVGAGPTGLWLAAELRRAEVPVLVLDRAEAPDQRSRALTVHPRMIEMLAMRGMEKPFLDEGYTLPLGHFAQLDTWLDFRPLPTRHPYTLIFPQARTEELLQERAIELGRSPEVKQLTRAEAIELLIVVAGARRDLGEHDAAVVTLQIPELDPARRDPWSARLFYAYADNLLAAGRTSDAIQWFVHAYDADEDDETDAAERIAELTGEPLDQVEVDFLPDEVDEDADSAGAQPDDARPDDAEREDAEREPDSASEGSDEHDSSAEDSAQPKGDADASADEVVSPDPAGSSPDSVAADQPDAEPSPTAPDTGNRVGRPDPVGSAPVTEPAQLPATTAAGVAAAPARPSEEESAP